MIYFFIFTKAKPTLRIKKIKDGKKNCYEKENWLVKN